MKKLLVVACGLSMVGAVQVSQAGLTLDNSQALAEAVVKLPETLLDIASIGKCMGTRDVAGKCSTGSNFEDTYNVMTQSLKSMVTYKKGAVVRVAGKDVTLTNKNAAKLKLISLRDIIKSSSKFIGLTVELITIIKDRVFAPVLNILGKQSSMDPVLKVTTVATNYKAKLDEASASIGDIIALISLMSDSEIEA